MLSSSDSHSQEQRRMKGPAPTFLSMFHWGQQSSEIMQEHRRRNLVCHNQMRMAQFELHTAHRHWIPTELPTPPIPSSITLSMEVQKDDVTSILGQHEAWAQNDSISEIISETDCLIQFADKRPPDASNRFRYFNQVSITGNFPGIDHAHRRIRDLSPITIALSLKNIKSDLVRGSCSGKRVAELLTEWCSDNGKLVKYEKIQFYVTPVPWLSPMHMQDSLLVIRGSHCDSREIVEASKRLSYLLFDSVVDGEFCSRIEIPIAYRRWIVGSPDGVLVRQISTLSGATIHFPASTKGDTPTSFFISGSADACVTALKMFHDVSPVRLEFEIDDKQLSERFRVDEENRSVDLFDMEHNVMVSLRRSQYEGNPHLKNEKMRHTISMMTSEENLNNLYVVRRLMLKEKVYQSEKQPNRKNIRPCFMEYLRLLINEASLSKKPAKEYGKTTAKPTAADKKRLYHNNSRKNLFCKSHGGFGDHKNN